MARLLRLIKPLIDTSSTACRIQPEEGRSSWDHKAREQVSSQDVDPGRTIRMPSLVRSTITWDWSLAAGASRSRPSNVAVVALAVKMAASLGGCSVMNGLIRPCRQRHKEQAPDRYFVGRDELREMA